MIIIDKNKLLCPTCGCKMISATAAGGGESTFWMRCSNPNCHTYVDTYIPLKHQKAIHKDAHRYVGVFGGYGSGKTQCSLKDDMKHMLMTPNGTTVVGSAVLAQIEQTYEKDFLNDFPKDFIMSQNKTKKTYTLINGHTLLIKSYYEEGLLRSLTVSRAHIVEASEVDHSIFIQLQSRLRNVAGTIIEKDEDGNPIFDAKKNAFKLKVDWRKMIIESNPSAGWIRDEFLLCSEKLHLNGSNEYYSVSKPIKTYVSHVIPTKCNVYLPDTFYEDNAAGKPDWWIRRYLEGSFDYAEGMVYPSAMHSFCEPFSIPKDWKRFVGWDYGIRDDTAIIFGAVDSTNGVLYVFKEIYINNVNYEVIGKMYKEALPECVPEGTLYSPAVMDGRSINKRNDFNLMTIGDLFASVGIYLEAAKMDVDARVLKVNTMLEHNRLRIFKNCKNLCREILNYKFPERTVEGKMKAGGDKPMDKNNHAINAMEFMVMETPDDLKHLENIAYDEHGRMYTRQELLRIKNKSNNSNPYGIEYNPFTPKKRETSPMDDLFGTGSLEDIEW